MSYHSCGFRNRNGANKLTDFYNGERCITPTSYCCWQPAKKKYLERGPYPTRYALRTRD